MPISISGVRAAQEREALHRIEQASASREQVRQQLHLRIRSAWLSLTNGCARLQTLRAAARADQARLEATLQWAWQQTQAPPPPAASSRKSQN